MANIRVNRKSGVVVRGGVSRRETVWLGFQYAQTVLAASATAALVYSLNAAALALLPFTIVRTRMNWTCQSDQSAATEDFIGNFGWCVVSDQAAAIGVTAVPTPAFDLSSDLWFLIDQWIGTFQLIGSNVTTNMNVLKIDSKSMRKVEVGQDIVGVAEAGITESGVTVRTVGRMLVKLH